MTKQLRKDGEREQRHQRIVTAAHQLAEAEGWDAVTTRRLADAIGYSQPVLYSHFANKNAIMAAVAVQGFVELADALRAARAKTADPRKSLSATVNAFVGFAADNPARYDVMFTLHTGLVFASEDTPAELVAAYDELSKAVRPFATKRNLEAKTEVLWAAIHGLITLGRANRLRPAAHRQRVTLLVDAIAN